MPRFKLIRNESGLALADEMSLQRPLRIDFSSNQLAHRRLRGGRKELLLKAVDAAPGKIIWDCTAGLGTDAFLMAAAGCQVHLFERSRVLYLLLEQALEAEIPDTDLADVLARMTLHHLDARVAMQSMPAPPDVIYIDPMFPERRKTAQVKGSMQILQRFIGTDEDLSGLLESAFSVECPRVVVKRPAGAELPCIGGGPATEPAFSLHAKANRFDVFLRT